MSTCMDPSISDPIAFLNGLGFFTMKLGLSRMQHCLEILGNPQDALPTIHIAGTNGKGSVSAMLSTVLRTAGYTVGTFTSPHLVDVRERIAINGQPVSLAGFEAATHRLRDALHEIPKDDYPTYFEFLTLLAYGCFQAHPVDVMVMETGLGGRLDSTNCVSQPALTVITGIGLDHTEVLGETLAQIASEKAGILKPHCPVVIGGTLPDEALCVIEEKAHQLACPVWRAQPRELAILPESSLSRGLVVSDGQSEPFHLSLLAPYQVDNLATVLACLDALRQAGYRIPETAVRQGLKQTVWPARFQVLRQANWVIDGSHNPAGFQSLQASIAMYFPATPLLWLLTLQRNRDPAGLRHLIEQCPNTQAVICTVGEPTGLYHSADRLHAVLAGTTPAVFPEPDLTRAMSLATALQHQKRNYTNQPSPVVIATGSLYTTGYYLNHFSVPQFKF